MLTIERSEKYDAEMITIPERLRHMDESRVAELMESMAKIGQVSPIQVRLVNDGEQVVLVAGHHRLEAARRLGWEKITINFIEGDDVDYRLWEIAENLHRAELTVLERAEHVAAWLRLHQEYGKERLIGIQEAVAAVEQLPVSRIGPGSPLASKGGRVGKLAHPKNDQPHNEGITAAAKEFGVDRKEIRRAREVADIAPEAKHAAREAGLDKNQSALLKVASAPKEEQVQAVRNIAAEKAAPKPKPPPQAKDHAEELADMLLEHLPDTIIPAFISLYQAVVPATVVKAIRRRLKDRRAA